MSGDVAVFKGWDFDFNKKNLVEGFWSISFGRKLRFFFIYYKYKLERVLFLVFINNCTYFFKYLFKVEKRRKSCKNAVGKSLYKKITVFFSKISKI